MEHREGFDVLLALQERIVAMKLARYFGDECRRMVFGPSIGHLNGSHSYNK